MRHKIISVSKAKARLLALTREINEDGEAFLLTKDGEPVGALVPLADYEALLETADVLASDATVNLLEKALDDEKKGRLWKRDKKGQWTRVRTKGKSRAA